MAERLKQIRRRKFMTQQELAEAAGVRWTTISQIENGHRIPRFSTIKALAAALGVDPAELVDAA